MRARSPTRPDGIGLGLREAAPRPQPAPEKGSIVQHGALSTRMLEEISGESPSARPRAIPIVDILWSATPGVPRCNSRPWWPRRRPRCEVCVCVCMRGLLQWKGSKSRRMASPRGGCQKRPPPLDDPSLVNPLEEHFRRWPLTALFGRPTASGPDRLAVRQWVVKKAIKRGVVKMGGRS